MFRSETSDLYTELTIERFLKLIRSVNVKPDHHRSEAPEPKVNDTGEVEFPRLLTKPSSSGRFADHLTVTAHRISNGNSRDELLLTLRV
ncbi:hypothetical protein F2Q69_00053629 [Brassica cretica]|uniref:Uncharacterized protein n=1 Tax=Brassica cretica TaxID=69181 RepID=A0A8S9MYJ9_BRACR|nr:hypothetical protein F2Q69_00053629 [Brassica cretica]